MEATNWSQLPHTAVVNMLAHLSPRDRARASSTCTSWRDCYFHPSFWRRVDLELTPQTGCEPARCILAKCGRFVRDLYLACPVLVPVGPDDLLRYKKLNQDLPSVLHGLHKNEGLEKLVFSIFPQCCNCKLGRQLRDVAFEMKLTESLMKIIQASSKLKTLALAHNLGSLQSDFLKEISDKFGKQLRVLHLPNLQVPSLQDLGEAVDEAIPLTVFFSKFASLSILTLNLAMVTDPLLKCLPDSKCASTLRQLNLVIGFSGRIKSYCDDSSWASLDHRLPDLQVTASAVVSYEEETEDLMDILSPNIPLTSLRMFINHLRSPKEELMDDIAKNYSKSLSCLEIHTDEPVLLFDNSSETDPLVMLCWRCKKLNRLVITGYKLLTCNVLAIATLRGPGLSTFEVEGTLLYGDQDEPWAGEEYDEEAQTSHDSLYSDGTFSDSPTSETEHRFSLVQDISSRLKRPWEPVERRHMTVPKFLTQDLQLDVE